MKTGFRGPLTTYAYLNAADGVFYEWDHKKDEAVNIDGTFLGGRVVYIDFAVKEFKKKENPKIKVYVSHDDGTVVLELGKYTTFARSLLQNLKFAALSERKPLRGLTVFIHPVTGEEQNSFARLYTPSGKYYFDESNTVPYPATEDEVDALAEEVVELLNKVAR